MVEREQTQSGKANDSLEDLTTPGRPFIPARLTRALEALAGMRDPSVVHILSGYGYEYEASQVSELIEAWAELRETTTVPSSCST
jgi:hypothetical protein